MKIIKKYKTRDMLVYLLVIIAAILSLTACKKEEAADILVSDIVNSLGDKIAIDSGLKNIEDLNWDKIDLTKDEGKEICDSMEFNKEWIEEGIYCSSKMNIKAECIVVVKAREDEFISEIDNSFSKLKEVQEEKWKYYLPEQYEQVKNAKIKVKGRYVMYFVYEDNSKLTNLVDNIISK